MKDYEKEIMIIVSTLNEGEAVHLRSIDMRLMKSHPEVIINRRLIEVINSLISDGYLCWIKINSSVVATDLGKAILQ
jgi:hypothetical protein